MQVQGDPAIVRVETVLIRSVVQATIIFLVAGLPLLKYWPSAGIGVSTGLCVFILVMTLFTIFGDGGETETLTANEDDCNGDRLP